MREDWKKKTGLRDGLFLQHFQPFADNGAQALLFGLHVLRVVEHRQPSAICVVAFQQPGRIFHLRSTRKYQPDAILLEQIEYHDISPVLLGIRWLHQLAVKESRRIPLDLFSDYLIRA